MNEPTRSGHPSLERIQRENIRRQATDLRALEEVETMLESLTHLAPGDVVEFGVYARLGSLGPWANRVYTAPLPAVDRETIVRALRDRVEALKTALGLAREEP